MTRTYRIWNPDEETEADARFITNNTARGAVEAYAEREDSESAGEAFSQRASQAVKVHVRMPEGDLQEFNITAEFEIRYHVTRITHHEEES